MVGQAIALSSAMSQNTLKCLPVAPYTAWVAIRLSERLFPVLKVLIGHLQVPPRSVQAQPVHVGPFPAWDRYVRDIHLCTLCAYYEGGGGAQTRCIKINEKGGFRVLDMLASIGSRGHTFALSV